MKAIHKNKSRAKLWQLMSGAKEITGGAGVSAVGDIVFANIPLVTETVTINGVWFGFKVGAAEAAGTSAGTEADPHLCSVDTSLDAVGISLAAQILAETETTGAWGFLYPDDSVGVDWTTDTLTLTFWPGTAGNSVVLAGSAGDETITQPVGGLSMPTISSEVKTNIIDTTGSTTNKEHYYLADGDEVGETATITIKSDETGDTPTILGHLSEAGVAMVEAEFVTAEPGASATFEWNGTVWEMISFNTLHTVPDFTASA